MSGDGDDPPQREVDLFQHYRTEARFEEGLVSGRLTLLLSSQSFLVIAYASSMGASSGDWDAPLPRLLPPALALLGIVLTLCAWPGVLAAHAVAERWHEKERELLAHRPELGPWTLTADEDGRRDVATRRREGALFARRAPLALLIAWTLFAALPFWLRHLAAS